MDVFRSLSLFKTKSCFKLVFNNGFVQQKGGLWKRKLLFSYIVQESMYFHHKISFAVNLVYLLNTYDFSVSVYGVLRFQIVSLSLLNIKAIYWSIRRYMCYETSFISPDVYFYCLRPKIFYVVWWPTLAIDQQIRRTFLHVLATFNVEIFFLAEINQTAHSSVKILSLVFDEHWIFTYIVDQNNFSFSCSVFFPFRFPLRI